MYTHIDQRLRSIEHHLLIIGRLSPSLILMATRFLTHTLLFFLFSATLLASSKLEWDRTEAHIDLEPDQEEARAVFTLTNKGDKAIRIARVKTSCGCTGSVISNKIIEPGKTAEIVGTFNKGKRQGLNRNRLEVFIDNQAESIATLLMNVKIPTLIEAVPKVVYWNSGSNKSERSVRVTLEGQYLDTIERIEYDRTNITLINEASEPGTDVDRVLKITPKNFDQLYRGTITIYGSGPDGRTAESRVHVFVQP